MVNNYWLVWQGHHSLRIKTRLISHLPRMPGTARKNRNLWPNLLPLLDSPIPKLTFCHCKFTFYLQKTAFCHCKSSLHCEYRNIQFTKTESDIYTYLKEYNDTREHAQTRKKKYKKPVSCLTFCHCKTSLPRFTFCHYEPILYVNEYYLLPLYILNTFQKRM